MEEFWVFISHSTTYRGGSGTISALIKGVRGKQFCFAHAISTQI